MGFPGGSDDKESACNAGDPGSIPGSGRFPWRREWQLTPVFLPGESQGQRSLAGYNPRDCKESDMTDSHIHTHTHTHTLVFYDQAHKLRVASQISSQKIK